MHKGHYADDRHADIHICYKLEQGSRRLSENGDRSEGKAG